MEITAIKESGTSNVLKWAIRNKADIVNNMPLCSIINDELFYLVDIDDINFYELFRLTQLYRNKIRILDSYRAEIPNMEYLKERFSLKAESVHKALESCMGLVRQMISDNDIIHENTIKMFIPMIASKFKIQIPFSFIDIIGLLSDEDASEIFSSNYPQSLEKIITDFVHPVKHGILLSVDSNTRNIKYDNTYEQLIKTAKHFPVKNAVNNESSYKVHTVGLIGFSKFNNVTRGEVRCNLFQADSSNIPTTLKQLANISTTLKLDFAIKLPIYNMQMLEYRFFPEDLKISYRSSAKDILDNGLLTNDFIYRELDPDDENYTSHENSISAYRTRIRQANHSLLSVITELVKPDATKDYHHQQSIISLLPPIYLTNAVLTINYTDIPNLLNIEDPILNDMFREIKVIADSIYAEIKSYKN